MDQECKNLVTVLRKFTTTDRAGYPRLYFRNENLIDSASVKVVLSQVKWLFDKLKDSLQHRLVDEPYRVQYIAICNEFNENFPQGDTEACYLRYILAKDEKTPYDVRIIDVKSLLTEYKEVLQLHPGQSPYFILCTSYK